MSDNTRLIAACERLWERATTDSAPVPSGTGQITSWKLEEGSRVIVASSRQWELFTLAADFKGTRRTIEILEGERIVFKASQQGAGMRTHFIDDKHYTHPDPPPEKPWTIERGDLPADLEVVA